MAYIIYRKIIATSQKKKWIPPNRKYKWMFYTLLSIGTFFVLHAYSQGLINVEYLLYK